MSTGTTATDPCQIAEQLRTARREVAMGGKAVRVAFRSGDVERDVRYTTADVQLLNSEIAYYEGLCAAKNGARPIRHMIRAG